MNILDKDTVGFLRGGGEMGQITRDFDWSKTSLGSPEAWPLSLCTTVGIVLNSAFPMFLFWGKDLICFYNDAFRPSLGVNGKHPAVGKKGREVWSDIWDFVGPLFENVMKTGEPVYFEDQLVPFYRNGKTEQIYWTFSYSPAYGDDGQVAGVFATCTETTHKVNLIAELEESKNRLQFAIDAAELGTWELNPLTNTFKGNDRLKQWFGLDPQEEIPLSLATNVIAEKDRSRVLDAIAKAITFESGGNYDVEYTIQNPVNGKETVVKAKGRAYFDEHQKPYNFSGTLQDITNEAITKHLLGVEMAEQKLAKQQLEESELFSHDVFYNSPVAKLVFTGPEMRIARINENMLKIFGRDHAIVGKTLTEAIPELAGTPLIDRLTHVFATGETCHQPEQELDLMRFGKPHLGYYNYIYKALVSTSGEIYGVMVTATEVTAQVLARQGIEAKEKELRDLITSAPIGICVLSGDPIRVEEVNDRFILNSGKTRAQFENNPFWEVMKEVASAFEPILDNVFKTGVKYSSQEHEMVVIRHGIPEKIFSTFEYIPVLDSQNKVVKVILMAIEVTHQVETRLRIEEAVVERTKELAESNLNLQRSNAELEQFAFIASHDLQEPVRKISTFTQMLEQSVADLSEKSKSYISKIYGSTDRMTKLIRDVLAFSQVSQNTESFSEVDLRKIIIGLETDFELLIERTGATLTMVNLPTVYANASQMLQLFGNLLSNSLKYIRKDIKPVISISGSKATKEEILKHPQLSTSRNYHKIEFSDNGIGFAQEHADRIFNIFQRLHGKNEFEGTGIGLSMCRKIVQSHQGHISAKAGDNGGAVFMILLPYLEG